MDAIVAGVRDQHQAFIIQTPDMYCLVSEIHLVANMNTANQAVFGMLAFHFIANMR